MKEIIEELIKNSKEKLSIKQISDITGIPRSSVKRYCDQLGYEPIRHEAWNKNKKIPKVTRSKRGKMNNEIKYKISQTMKNNPLAGGHRKGSGRGEKKTYKNILFNSEYCLAIARILDKEEIKWEKPDKLFTYIDKNGINKESSLDFYLPEYNCYVSVKEFITNDIRYKLKSISKINNIKVVVVDDFVSRRIKYTKFKYFLENVLKKI